MSRSLRIEYEDTFYHVMNCGRGRQRVFIEDAYCPDFLRCLAEAYIRFRGVVGAPEEINCNCQ